MANCVGVCNGNFLDVAASKTASSERVSYLAENVYNLDKRKKVWRTGGYWNIESGSNTIVFRESVGVDLTATIPAMEYTDTVSLLLAIEAAMEAVGGSDYVVALNGQGKFTFTSDGTGGGGIFQLMWTDSASLNMADILGFDTASDQTGSLSYTADVLRIHTEEFLLWDLGFPSNPKAFVLVSDRNNPLKVSPSATVKIQGNTTNSFATPQVDLTVNFTDFVLAKWNTEGLAGTTPCRYWRFHIQDKENHRQYVEFGAVYLGDMHDATRGCVVFPLEKSGIDRSEIITAEHGQVFAREIPKAQSFRLGWEGLTKVEERSLWQHFEDVGLTKSFFLILDLQDAFSVTEEESVILCKFEQAPDSRLISPNNFQSSWQVREQL